MNTKMPTMVGIFMFISRENFMFSWVEHENLGACFSSWSDYSFSTWRRCGSLDTHRIYRLIWVFTVRTCHLVGNAVHQLKYIRCIKWLRLFKVINILSGPVQVSCSPEPKAQDELLWSLPVRRPSVHTFERLLLWNPFCQVSSNLCEAFCERENDKLYKWSRSIY